MRVWCVECDIFMGFRGIALDCPIDGQMFECDKCNKRIVIFEDADYIKKERRFSSYIKANEIIK